MVEHIFKSLFKDHFCRFMDFCGKSYSDNTCRIYGAALASFDAYLCSTGQGADGVTEEMVSAWISSIGPRADNTVRGYLKVIRSFSSFMAGFGIPVFFPEAKKNPDSYSPYIFTDNEMDSIFSIADNYDVRPNCRLPYISLEMPMILRVLYGCGTRLGETLSLRAGDIDHEAGMLTIRHAKRDKERIVPMHPSLSEIIRKYCASMGLVGKTGAYVFPKISLEEHLAQNDVRNHFSRILRIAGICLPGRKFNERGPCLHCLRHGFVLGSFRQMEAGGIRIDDAVPHLSMYLGHSSLSETEKYMKFSPQMFPEELKRFEDACGDVFPEIDKEG